MAGPVLSVSECSSTCAHGACERDLPSNLRRTAPPSGTIVALTMAPPAGCSAVPVTGDGGLGNLDKISLSGATSENSGTWTAAFGWAVMGTSAGCPATDAVPVNGATGGTPGAEVMAIDGIFQVSLFSRLGIGTVVPETAGFFAVGPVNVAIVS